MAHLGPYICPTVISKFTGGYTMEYLDPLDPDPDTLCRIENALESRVWCRPPLHVYDPADWQAALLRRLPDTLPPAPPPHVREPALIHGDCTVSNAVCGYGGVLLLLDALPPKPHVPEQPEVDMGRILQSAAGWEEIRYGDDYIEYAPPAFWFRDEERRAALWWCGVTALRINRYEMEKPGGGNRLVKRWCTLTADRCFDAFCV